MLVAASMLIWGTHVSGLQFFGYGVALTGMVFYKLGYEALKNYFTDVNRQWAELGANRPVLRKIVVITFAGLMVFLFLGAIAPSYAPDLYSKVGFGSG